MLSKIHKIHMDISYNNNNEMFKNIGKYVAINGAHFINNFCISFNKKNNFDLTFEFAKNKILHKYVTEFVNSNINESLCMSSPCDVIIKHHKNELINSHLCKFLEEYNEQLYLYKSNKNTWEMMYYVYWKFIYPLYEWYNSCNTINDIYYLCALIEFVSRIEWFHFNVHVIIVKKLMIETEKNMYMFGNINQVIMHDLYLLHENDELKSFIKEEIPSHCIAFIVRKNKCTMYDPDNTAKKIKIQIKKLLVYINLNIEFEFINVEHPIQTITDDNYCIFHCIFMIFDMIQLKKDTLNDHIKRCNKQNISMTISDVRDKIIELQCYLKLN